MLCERTTTAIHDDRVELCTRRGDRGRPRDRRRGRHARGRAGSPDRPRGRPRRPRRRLAAHEHPGRLGGRRVRRAPRRASSASSRPRWRWRARRAPTSPARPRPTCPAPVSTKLKVAGIDLFCSGELEGDDEVVALDTRAGYYRREVYRGDELVGQIVLGDPPALEPAPCRTRSSAPATASRARRSRPGSTSRGQARDARLDRLRRLRRRRQALLDEAAEVGFQAVQVEGAKAIEVLMRRPVEVGRAGRRSGPLARGGV